jgi:hypothetical protein
VHSVILHTPTVTPLACTSRRIHPLDAFPYLMRPPLVQHGPDDVHEDAHDLR